MYPDVSDKTTWKVWLTVVIHSILFRNVLVHVPYFCFHHNVAAKEGTLPHESKADDGSIETAADDRRGKL